MDLNSDGLASLKPTINNILANTANGIKFSTKGMRPTQVKMKTPCKIAAIFDLPPD
jgi:hypothetical protein